MPFDGIGFAFDERVSKMDEVIQLLATPDKWCKGTLRTYDGHRCIRGAMMAVEEAQCLAPIILRAIRDVTGKRYFSIESFNDHPSTHHAQVLHVLAKARDDLIRMQPTRGAVMEPATRAGWRARLYRRANSLS
jgi:hypothetical protein